MRTVPIDEAHRFGILAADPDGRVNAFVEKPDEPTAQALIASGDHLWNSGLFLLGAKAYLDELARLRPAMLARCREALEAARGDLDFLRLARAPFEMIEAESIDYAVMEQTQSAAVMPIQLTSDGIPADAAC